MRKLDAKDKPAERRNGSFGPRAGKAEDPVVLEGGTKGPRPKGLQNVSNVNPRAAENAARSMAAAKLLDVRLCSGGVLPVCPFAPISSLGLKIHPPFSRSSSLGRLVRR